LNLQTFLTGVTLTLSLLEGNTSSPVADLAGEDGILEFQLKISEFGAKLSIFLNLGFLLGVLDGWLANLFTNTRPGGAADTWEDPVDSFFCLGFFRPWQ
jgi:hypothetical protein